MREANDAPASRPDAADDTRRQPPRLSPEEVARIENLEEWEHAMEEPTEGELSIISDEDVPGAPRYPGAPCLPGAMTPSFVDRRR